MQMNVPTSKILQCCSNIRARWSSEPRLFNKENNKTVSSKDGELMWVHDGIKSRRPPGLGESEGWHLVAGATHCGDNTIQWQTLRRGKMRRNICLSTIESPKEFWKQWGLTKAVLHNDRLSFFFSRNAEIVSITHLWFEFFHLEKSTRFLKKCSSTTKGKLLVSKESLWIHWIIHWLIFSIPPSFTLSIPPSLPRPSEEEVKEAG